MKHLVRIALLGGLIVVGGISSADARSDGPGLVGFDRLDVDGDGKISKAEMDARAKLAFEARDANGDGKLSRAELEAGRQKKASERAERMLKKFDEDGDGYLTRQEMPNKSKFGGRRDGFAKIDTNDDGSVDRAEYEAAQERFANRARKRWWRDRKN